MSPQIITKNLNNSSIFTGNSSRSGEWLLLSNVVFSKEYKSDYIADLILQRKSLNKLCTIPQSTCLTT